MPRWKYEGKLEVFDLEEDTPVTVHGEDHAIEISLDANGCLNVQPLMLTGDGEEDTLQPIGRPIPFSALLKKDPVE